MYIPDLNGFVEKSKKGNLIPVYREILADFDTPVTAFMKINDGRYSFLLESLIGGEKWARYSFLGSNPSLIFKSYGNRAEITDGDKVETIYSENPLNILRNILKRYKPVIIPDLPRFFGGAVGYMGYDMVRFFEKLPNPPPDDLQFNDSVFLVTDTIIIFDNLKQKIKVVSNAFIDEGEDPEDSYKKAVLKIEELIKKLREPVRILRKRQLVDKPILYSSNMKKEKFIEIVEKAKRYIFEGDIIQVVLSQRFEIKENVDPFNVYRALRTINPSPYMFFLKIDDLYLIGSSPEILVRVEDGIIELRPIAGTRPRGKNEEEDSYLMEELRKDPKELAEHIMLVDLGRNDVGRVAEIGSVKVTDLMVIEKYSHVMHLVSHIKGLMRRDSDCFDVLMCCFPAGTVTGAPKIRAMEIIDELEDVKRGIYAGSVGYFSFSGNMDHCITIRTIIIKGENIYIQAGAGIVADSNPEREYEETVNKAAGMIKAVEMALREIE